MSISLLRLAPLSLSLSLSLVACAADDSGEPISSQESAATTQAVEGMVVAMAPVTSSSPSTIAAAYRATFGTGGLSCATVATDSVTFVTVTFACGGLLATTGSLHYELTSPTTFEATADLTIGGVAIDAALAVKVPANSSEARTFEGELTIAGTRRTLTADVSASWTEAEPCVTYSASGTIVAEGPRGTASAELDVDARTVCR